MKRALALVVLAMACDRGLPRTLGLDEPIRVHLAQFIPGDLPGAPPDAGSGGASVTAFVIADPIVLPGQANKSINGRANKDAVSVGLRFTDLGSGWWVLPVGTEDAQFPGEFTWQAVSDFNPLSAHAPGNHPVRVVAIDANGKAGDEVEFTLCLEPWIPDFGATCNPAKTPPALVISLSWDSPVDVDLGVIGPDGKLTNAKSPTTIAPDAGVLDPTSGVIDRDSLGTCVEDSLRQEDLVFKQAPPTGTVFDVYANLFDACGQRGAAYVATVYTFPNGAPVAGQSAKGIFTSYDANGGAGFGTYLFSYTF